MQCGMCVAAVLSLDIPSPGGSNINESYLKEMQ
jgi:hypothetical protein